MKKDLSRTVALPEGVTVSVSGKEVTVKKGDKESKNVFYANRVDIKPSASEVVISAKKATRRESRMIGTITAHLNNMIKGVTDGFEYKLEVCNVHFPMNVKVEGDKLVIKSFLGEKTPREASIIPGAKVDVKGSQITVTSHEIEKAGQTAANIEKAARLSGRDRRIFQDGIFITEKNGRAI